MTRFLQLDKAMWYSLKDWMMFRSQDEITMYNKLALYGTDGRLFATDVSANFKIT